MTGIEERTSSLTASFGLPVLHNAIHISARWSTLPGSGTLAPADLIFMIHGVILRHEHVLSHQGGTKIKGAPDPAPISR